MTSKTLHDLRTGNVYTPMKSYKVAICLSGKLRNFRHTAQFLKRYVVDPLKADVFFFGSNTNTPETDEQDLIELLQPKKFVIHNDTLYIDPDYNNCKRAEANPTAIVYQAYNIFKSNQLKCEYEQDNNFKYDIVMRCRTDCFFQRSFVECELINAKKGLILIPSVWHFKDVSPFALCDMFAISNSENMDIYSDLYNRIPGYKHKCIIHSESLVGHHLLNETKLHVRDITNSPFFFEYPVDWEIPPGYNRETYRQAF